MDYKVLDDFIVNFNPNNVLDLESFEKLGSYREMLNNRYASFIERVTNNYFELSENEKNSSYYLINLIEKLRNRKELLFGIENDIIFYRYKKSLTVEPVQKGDLYSEASNIQYYYLNKAIDYLTEQRSVIITPYSTQTEFTSENKKEVVRRETVGFRIRNTNNLPRAFYLLRNAENKFISTDVTLSTFTRNFTGRHINRKIIWTESDKCLHYFIDGIYGKLGNYGLGVEEEDDGQWNKASDCFCKKDGSPYDSGNLSRTKDPSKAQKEKLNIIIAQINKQPKKKD
jgi:hypothetical protein